jgi:predicted nucleotidyltransferase
MSLIGASALAFHMEMTWRNTADIDVVLAVEVGDLDAAEAKLVGWTRQHPPRWVAPNKVKVDLVLAPAEALARRELIWDGWKMNLAGIGAALANKAQITVSQDIDIAVAPVPIIALLKMAAYLDKPERDKDLRDLGNILNAYPPTDDDRFFTDAILDERLSEEQARGAILAREIVALADSEDRDVVRAFVSKMRKEEVDWSRFVDASPWKYDEPRLRLHFDAFCDAYDKATRPKPVATTRLGGHKVRLKFIVNGEGIELDAAADEPLSVAVAEALAKTNNTGRPPSDWELRLESGIIIADQTRTVAESGLAAGTVLYLSLKAGAGGNASRA